MHSPSVKLRIVAGLVVFCVSGCGGGPAATKADYDKITGGMTRQAVDTALAALGAGQPTTAADATKPVGPYAFNAEGQREILAELTLYKWGNSEEFVYGGFDKNGVIRAKGLRTKNQMASETFNVLLVNGKVTFPAIPKKK